MAHIIRRKIPIKSKNGIVTYNVTRTEAAVIRKLLNDRTTEEERNAMPDILQNNYPIYDENGNVHYQLTDRQYFIIRSTIIKSKNAPDILKLGDDPRFKEYCKFENRISLIKKNGSLGHYILNGRRLTEYKI